MILASSLFKLDSDLLLPVPDLPGFNRRAHGVQPGPARLLGESFLFFGSCLLHGRFSSLIAKIVFCSCRLRCRRHEHIVHRGTHGIIPVPACLFCEFIFVFGSCVSHDLCLLNLSGLGLRSLETCRMVTAGPVSFYGLAEKISPGTEFYSLGADGCCHGLCLSFSLSFGPKIIPKAFFRHRGDAESQMRKRLLCGSGNGYRGIGFCPMAAGYAGVDQERQQRRSFAR